MHIMSQVISHSIMGESKCCYKLYLLIVVGTRAAMTYDCYLYDNSINQLGNNESDVNLNICNFDHVLPHWFPMRKSAHTAGKTTWQ